MRSVTERSLVSFVAGSYHGFVMATKKIPASVVRAFIKRHVIPSVSTVVEDVDRVRVDPGAPGSPTPPWRRGVPRKHSGEQLS